MIGVTSVNEISRLIDVSLVAFGLVGTTVPIAIGIAIMRYRLYDIDRIVSRTLSWTAVTGVLLVVFVGAVVGLQGLLAGFTQGQTLAVAGSTILAFALFQPLRRRIQQAIDRRFDRSRYHADLVVAALGDRLSHVVDLDALLGEIERVAEETVRPTSSVVWLRAGSKSSRRAWFVTMRGRSPSRITGMASFEFAHSNGSWPDPYRLRLPSRPIRKPRRRRRQSSRVRRSTSPSRIRSSPTFRPRPGRSTLRRLDLASPALERLREAGVALVVPLVTQGELIGTLNLGPRLSEQEYSSDDRRLLATLAAQAAPAIRVAQLVREQTAEAAERERYDQELRVAQLIQQQFLPRELPSLPEWQVAAYYGPARVVGGDFYDFIDLGRGPDRRRRSATSPTRGFQPRSSWPGRTRSFAPRRRAWSTPAASSRARTSCSSPEMPDNMFVTCLYRRAGPGDGPVRLRQCRSQPAMRPDGRRRRRARGRPGMPLGLLPGRTTTRPRRGSRPGDDVLLYSDGLVEAHSPDRRDVRLPAAARRPWPPNWLGSELIDDLLERLHAFTGPGWEQEDDITVVTLRRARAAEAWSPRLASAIDEPRRSRGVARLAPLVAFSLPGAIGDERLAMDRVAEAVAALGLAPARLERLKTAVGETVMNAIEYGSQGDPDVPVDVRVDATDAAVTVRVTDRALSGPVPGSRRRPISRPSSTAASGLAVGACSSSGSMVDSVECRPTTGSRRSRWSSPAAKTDHGGRHERALHGRGRGHRARGGDDPDARRCRYRRRPGSRRRL